MGASRSDGSGDTIDGLRETLIIVDSVTSLVASRYSAGLPDDLVADLKAVSARCRLLAAQIKPNMTVTVCFHGENEL